MPRLLLTMCLYALCAALLLTIPAADQLVTMPATHITRTVDRVQAALPQTEIVLITNDDPHPMRAEKIRRLFARHNLPLTRIHDADLRRLADQGHTAPLTETTWAYTDQRNQRLCVISVNKVDYNGAGSDYWRASWDITDPSFSLAVDPVAIGNWDVNHELYHCIAYALDFPSPSSTSDTARQLYEEAGADAFAGLMHLREGGGRELLRLIALIRRARVADDQEHYTHDALDALYAASDRYNQVALARLTPIQLAYLARHAVDANWAKMTENLARLKAPGNTVHTLQASGVCQLHRLARLWSSSVVAHQPRGGWGLRLFGGQQRSTALIS